MTGGVGQRDRRITIETCTDGVGPSRFPTEQWAPLVALWAQQTAQGGSEDFSADHLTGTTEDLWTIPYRADCDPDLVDVVKARRVRRHGRVYDILGARLLDTRQAIELRTRAQAQATA